MAEETPTKPRGERLSVYAGEPIALVLTGHDENRSARLNNVADRYLQIVGHDSPTWTEAQWSAVCDALNGCWLSDEASIRFAWAEVADADRLNGLGAKWGIDATALAAEIRDMTHGQRVAVVEIVERFWRHCELPTLAALKQAGAKIAGAA